MYGQTGFDKVDATQIVLDMVRHGILDTVLFGREYGSWHVTLSTELQEAFLSKANLWKTRGNE